MSQKCKLLVYLVVVGIGILTTNCQEKKRHQKVMSEYCNQVETYDKSEFGNYNFIKIQDDTLSERNSTVPFYRFGFVGGPETLQTFINGEKFINDRVNDSQGFGSEIDGDILKSGEQKILIRMLPLPGEEYLREEANFEIEVYAHDINAPNAWPETVFEFKSGQVIQQGEKLKEYVEEFTFNAETVHQIDAWQNGEDLRALDSLVLRDKLISVYCFLYQKVINEGHIEAFEELKYIYDINNVKYRRYRTRNGIAFSNYNKTYFEADKKNISIYLDFENTVIKYSEDGKLAWLENSETKMSPLSVSKKDAEKDIESFKLYSLYRLKFFIPKGYTQLVPIK